MVSIRRGAPSSRPLSNPSPHTAKQTDHTYIHTHNAYLIPRGLLLLLVLLLRLLRTGAGIVEEGERERGGGAGGQVDNGWRGQHGRHPSTQAEACVVGLIGGESREILVGWSVGRRMAGVCTGQK